MIELVAAVLMLALVLWAMRRYGPLPQKRHCLSCGTKYWSCEGCCPSCGHVGWY